MSMVLNPYRFAAGSWQPSDLTGLEIWVEMDITTIYTDLAKTTEVTSNGDLVRCWADKSGNGNDFVQDFNDSYRPTYQTTYLRGDGITSGGDYLKCPFTISTTPAEHMFGIAFIPRNLGTNTDGVLQMSSEIRNPSGTPYCSITATTATNIQYYTDNGNRYNRTSAVADQITMVIRVTKPASNYLVDCWIDGTKQTQYDAGASFAAASAYILFFNGWSDYGQIDIAAFLFGWGTYSDTDAENVDGYLRAQL